jgi:hypothetical protein
MPINDQVAVALDSLVQEKKLDMQTIDVLLSFGTSVHYSNHRPLVTAAKSFNTTLLSLLLSHSKDPSSASVVFDTAMKVGSFWTKQDAFSILTILLENGAEGVSVDEALIKAVADTRASARHFEVVLLQSCVNIDHKAGEALQVATERGEPALVRRMLAMNPAPNSVSMAFPFAFFSRLGEDSTLAILESFVEFTKGELEQDFMHPEISEPPTFLCLYHHPNSLKILESTLNAGFPIDQTMSSESGKHTALYWALSAQGKNVGDPMVELLINRGGKLHLPLICLYL